MQMYNLLQIVLCTYVFYKVTRVNVSFLNACYKRPNAAGRIEAIGIRSVSLISGTGFGLAVPL